MDLSDDDVSPTSDVEDVSETHSKKIFEYVKLPNDDEYSDNENDDGSYTDSNEDYQSEPEQLNNMSIDPIVDVKSEPYDEDDDTAQYDETSESGTDTHNTDMYDFDAEHDPEAPQQKHSVTTRDMAEKRKDPKRLVCNFCKEIFIGKEVLEAHYKKKHTGIGKPFECKECGMSFKYMSVLRVHMRKHTGEKPFSCTLCDKTFCQKAYLDAHLKRHNGDKLYLCDECNKTFITQAHLKRHLVTHIQGKTFICTECGEEGPSETCQSEQHSRAYFEERPFVCQICDKRFSMHSAMINHSRTHTGEKPFSCELCQKTFTQRSNLSVHMKTHTGEKKFKCQFCDIAYLYKVNLDRHIRRAHGENSSYTCKECGESFSWRSSLHLHVLSHTGKDPFQCDYCDKKYVLQKCLWVHMRTHSGSVDFKCVSLQRDDFIQKSVEYVGIKGVH
ncbi:unnamed protein product [Owenia fusiformis]|uniref:C2H2-type domain-containing protein n=1 Tax=Owenia fusiformis TaxID=6347 RepID=A0A8S4PDM2_OWEFU|nr:unnamed protein product [Owenia fusiformis]